MPCGAGIERPTQSPNPKPPSGPRSLDPTDQLVRSRINQLPARSQSRAAIRLVQVHVRTPQQTIHPQQLCRSVRVTLPPTRELVDGSDPWHDHTTRLRSTARAAKPHTSPVCSASGSNMVTFSLLFTITGHYCLLYFVATTSGFIYKWPGCTYLSIVWMGIHASISSIWPLLSYSTFRMWSAITINNMIMLGLERATRRENWTL